MSSPIQNALRLAHHQAVGIQGAPTYDEAKSDLKAKISRDSRAELTRQKFLADLKKNYHFKMDDKAVKAIQPLIDTTIFRREQRSPNTDPQERGGRAHHAQRHEVPPGDQRHDAGRQSGEHPQPQA